MLSWSGPWNIAGKSVRISNRFRTRLPFLSAGRQPRRVRGRIQFDPSGPEVDAPDVDARRRQQPFAGGPVNHIHILGRSLQDLAYGPERTASRADLQPQNIVVIEGPVGGRGG